MHIKTADMLKLANENKPTVIEIIKAVKASYNVDRTKTIQTLLWLRDKNNWAGKRDFVRCALLWLKKHHEDIFNRVLRDFLLVGRWDDLFFSANIINENVLALIKYSLADGDTLLRKWLPKERTDPTMARVLAQGLGMTMKEYRLAVKKDEGNTFTNTLYRSIDSYKVNLDNLSYLVTVKEDVPEE